MTPPRRLKPGSVTVSEFKQWLAGVEAMQPQNWSPDPSQWKKIREKIKLLIDNEEVLPTVDHQLPQHNQPHAQASIPPQRSSIGPDLFSPAPPQPIRVIEAGVVEGIDYNVPGNTQFN